MVNYPGGWTGENVTLYDTQGNPYTAGARPTDAALVPSAGTTSGTATAWTELFPASATRAGGQVQNRDATNALFIVQSDTPPPNGTAAGEIEIAIKPNAYVFDFQPRKRWFIRGVAVSQSYGLVVW